MMRITYKYFAILVVMSTCFVNASSFAESIKTQMKNRLPIIVELKAKGIIGENNKGYLEFPGKKREKEEVVDAENEDRKKVYTAIAEKEKVSIDYVGQRRALQIAEIAKRGEWLQGKDGRWYKK